MLSSAYTTFRPCSLVSPRPAQLHAAGARHYRWGVDLPSSPTPKAGLAAIHARHSEWVKASMLRLLSDDGEDAAQEVWLRFSRQLGQLRSVEEPVLRAVLRRIMRSVCVDILRRRGPATQPLLDDDALPERAGPQAAEVRELAANVRQRWAQLPERERTI